MDGNPVDVIQVLNERTEAVARPIINRREDLESSVINETASEIKVMMAYLRLKWGKAWADKFGDRSMIPLGYKASDYCVEKSAGRRRMSAVQD